MRSGSPFGRAALAGTTFAGAAPRCRWPAATCSRNATRPFSVKLEAAARPRKRRDANGETFMNRQPALALGGAFLAAPAALSAQSLPHLTLGAVPEESVTPAVWAEQSGMFRKAGLDVDVQAASSGTAIAAGVAGGAYAVGKSSLVA